MENVARLVPFGKKEPIRLGRVTAPERQEIEINDRLLLAWQSVDGRYPQEIAGRLDDAREEYLRAKIPVFGPDMLPPADLVDACEELLQVMNEEQTEDGEPDPAQTERLAAVLADIQNAIEWAKAPRYRVHSVDWRFYQSQLLQIVIPGLTDEEVENLPDDVRYDLLVTLGVFKPREVQQTPEEAVAETQAEGGESKAPPESPAPSTGRKRGRGSRVSSA